jgi:hypothetical protein
MSDHPWRYRALNRLLDWSYMATDWLTRKGWWKRNG